MVFVSAFVYVAYSVYCIVNIVRSVHPCDDSHLFIVYDLFNVLLDVVCQYFVEDFSI